MHASNPNQRLHAACVIEAASGIHAGVKLPVSLCRDRGGGVAATRGLHLLKNQEVQAALQGAGDGMYARRHATAAAVSGSVTCKAAHI